MQFTKMNGAGNDFLILDGIREPLDLTQLPQLARTLCDRRFGLGAESDGRASGAGCRLCHAVLQFQRLTG